MFAVVVTKEIHLSFYAPVLCNSNFSVVIRAVLCNCTRRNEKKAVKQGISILFERQTTFFTYFPGH